MDLKHKRSIDPQAEEAKEITESSSSPLAPSNETKCCSYCQTTSTPLWRGGPAGPKSLCNACGIKYNKRKLAQASGFDKTRKKTSKNTKRNSLKVRLMVTDENQQQQQIKRKRSSYERGKPWWNKLREEEQAAILLMAISCGGSF